MKDGRNRSLGHINYFKNNDGRTIMNSIPLLSTTHSNNFNKDKLTMSNSLKDKKTLPSLNSTINTKELWNKNKRINDLELTVKNKDLLVKVLQKQIQSETINNVNNNNNNSNNNMSQLSELLLQLKNYIITDIQNKDHSDIINSKNNIIKALNSIEEHIKNLRRSIENNKEKDKIILDLKKNLEEYKSKNTSQNYKIEKITSELNIADYQRNELKSSKKVERIKKVIEPLYESVLAKENADLRRRLEIACAFLVKKKEEMITLNEKISILNKRIGELSKNKLFSGQEEEKINDIVSKKIKYEANILEITKHNKNLKLIRVEDLCYKCEYEDRNIDYRTNKLKEKYKNFIKEIAENGSSQFKIYFFSIEKQEQEQIIEFLADQMNLNNDYCKKSNQLLNFFIDSLNFDKNELMLYIRLKIPEAFGAERVTLWIYDDQINEYYTIINFIRYSSSGNDSYFKKVIKHRLYNSSTTVDESEIYSKTLNQQFSANAKVTSVIAIPVVDFSGHVYGIIEAVNCDNYIFGYDEEYLLYCLSIYIKWFLTKFSVEDAEAKQNKKDTLYTSIVNIMKRKEAEKIPRIFELEMSSLIEAFDCKLIINNSVSKTFSYFNDEGKVTQMKYGGIAGLCLQKDSNIYCKYPNDDDSYNPLIDIETSSNICFYSICLRKENHSIFAILQFTTKRDEVTDLQYKTDSKHFISKLDYYREKMIDIMSDALQHAILAIDANFFNK